VVLILFATFVACSRPVKESPPDMDALCHSLVLDFGTDAEAEEFGYLADWVDDEIADPEPGYTLDLLTDDDIDGLDHSDLVDLSTMYGAVVIRRTLGTIDQHSAVVPEEDQSFADSSYDSWDRTIKAGTADDYLAGGDLLTDNAIVKTTYGVTIPYPMQKEYHWLELDRGTVQVMRSIIYDDGWDDGGSNGVIGGFTIEMWIPNEDGGIDWLNATWTQVISSLGDLASEDFLTNQIINGSTEVMEGTEAYVTGGS
jgi:hypothetical protein